MPGTGHVPHADNPQLALWECLKSGFLVEKKDTIKDLIGISNPSGIELLIPTKGTVGLSPIPTKQFEVKEEALDEQSISEWIKRDSMRSPTNSRSLKLKVLLGDQVVYNDVLRPPEDAGGVRFSRGDLYSHFGCSPVALEKVARNALWTQDFPCDQRADKYVFCVGLGTLDFGLIWMRKIGCDTIWAFIVFQSPLSGTRQRFVTEFNRLGDFCQIPGFLPFVAITASIFSTEFRMNERMDLIRSSDLKLSRFPNERVANQIYGASLTSAEHVAIEQRHAKNMHKMVDKCLNMPAPAKVNKDPVLRKKVSGLKKAFLYQKQVLQCLLEDADEGHGRTARQIECVLSIMAQKQQQLSIEIAKAQSTLAEASRKEQAISVDIARASQTIAEETKKDGSSMKTLAVVTLIYLPCTTVSSILAMPLFNWDAKRNAVVNPRIWIFFLLAVPLTCMTIGVWRIWLSVRGRRKAKVVDLDSTSA